MGLAFGHMKCSNAKPRFQPEKNHVPNLINLLLLRNLHDVFGEIDPVRRRAAVDEIFHEDAVFYDPNGGIYRGRDEINRIAPLQPAVPV